MALRDDLSADRGIQRAVHVGQQQRARIAVAESLEGQLGEPHENVVPDARARSTDERDALGEQAPADEAEDLRGGVVEPLRVVDDADERLFLGDLGEQRERGKPHQEPIGWGAEAQPEHRRERPALGDGQPLEAVQHRRAELMEAGIVQLHLGLHTHGAGDMPVGDPVGQVAQQRTLTHTRLPAQDGDAAATGQRVGQQPVERLTFGTSPEEPRALTAILARRWPPLRQAPRGKDPPRGCEQERTSAISPAVDAGQGARQGVSLARRSCPSGRVFTDTGTTPGSTMAASTTDSPAQRGRDLLGQTVLVIGGSSGIGLETARLARAQGADVILTARNTDRLHRVGLELRASIAAFDATDFDRLETFFDALSQPIDHVLVTGPGPYYAPLAEFDVEAARRDVEAHLLLPLIVARHAASKVRPGGTLLFMGGTGGRRTAAGLTLISALTAALPAMTKNLAFEVAPVRVNVVAAGFVDTPLSASLLGDRIDDRRKQLSTTLPIGRVVGPADVAALAVHLMTNTAVTGATFDIDGGQQLVEG